VAAAKILEVKVCTSIYLACLPALTALPALFVPVLVLLKQIFFELICLEQSTSPRYLWFQSALKTYFFVSST